MSYAPLSTSEEEKTTLAHDAAREDERETLHDARPLSIARAPHDLTGHRLHLAISIAAGTVMCLFGYEQGVFGGIMVGADFLDYFHSPSPSLLGFVTSVYDLGCFAGAIFASLIGERLGRRWMLLVFTVIMSAGIAIQTGSTSMTMLVWGRFIAGVGNGGNTSTAPVWHVECSKAENKGRAVVGEMTVNVFGFVLSNVITLACSPLTSEAQWRFPLGVQLLFGAAILVMVWVLPESPRWLVARGRDAEARDVLARLSGDGAEDELKGIKESVRIEMASKARWRDVFSGGQASRRVLLGVLLQMAQQLSGMPVLPSGRLPSRKNFLLTDRPGINVLCYYLPLVLHKSVGLPELTSRILSTVNAVSYMLATGCSIFVIERIGRRPLLIVSAAFMSIAFLGIAISVGIGQAHPLENFIPGVIATVFMFAYFTAFSFGWIAVPWLYPAEINSLSMRSKGAALATASDWLFNYVVVQTTPIGMHYLGWALYLIYAVFNACFVPLVYFLVVETAGRSLEEIDRWFQVNRGWLVHRVDWNARPDVSMSINSDAGKRAIGDREAMIKAFELEDADDWGEVESR